MKKNILFVVIFLFLLKIIISEKETNTKLVLDQIVAGKIDKDNSHDFYELSLPKKIDKNSILVFTANENKINLKEDDIFFSDPDMYISRKKNPKNKKESDWYSESFGNDIITIPSKDLNTTKLYLTLFCEKK